MHAHCKHNPQLAAAKKAADQELDAAVARVRADLGSGSEALQTQLEEARKATVAAVEAAQAKEREMERWGTCCVCLRGPWRLALPATI